MQAALARPLLLQCLMTNRHKADKADIHKRWLPNGTHSPRAGVQLTSQATTHKAATTHSSAAARHFSLTA